ncbi:hypothetical protein ABK040_011453 [Willaertia magna]
MSTQQLSASTEDAINRVQTVLLTEFLTSRNSEIRSLQRDIINSNSNTRVFQRLPRHLRRRAMSKAPHLLPKHLRSAAIREIVLPKKIRQRKRRKDLRRKQFRKEFIIHLNDLIKVNSLNNTSLNENIINNNTASLNNKENEEKKMKKGYRLSTHMYHTKRMKMEDLWGFRLAIEHTTDKVFRNSYRFQKRHATIHDKSYMVCLQLEFQLRDHIELFLKSLMNLNNLNNSSKNSNLNNNLPFHKDYLIGKREGSFEWKDKENGFTISTIDFLIHSTQPILMIWLHPSSLPESFNLLKKEINDLEINDTKILHRNDLSRFEIRGPLSLHYLQQVCKIDYLETLKEWRKQGIVQNEEELLRNFIEEWEVKMLKLIAGNSPSTLPQDMVLSFMAKHPIYTSSFQTSFESWKKEVSLFSNNNSSNTSTTTANANNSIIKEESDKRLNALQKQLMIYIPKCFENQIDLIWDQQECMKRFSFHYLKRNKRTLNRMYSKGANSVIDKNNNNKDDNNNNTEIKGPSSYPMIIIQKPSYLNDGTNFSGGFDLILPTIDVSAHIWSKLCKQKNMMALPLVDRNRLLLEQGKRTFPYDYPSSQAFQRIILMNNEQQSSHLMNIINEIEKPLSTYQFIQIITPWGGSLENYNIIYQPIKNQEILLKILKEKKKLDPIPKHSKIIEMKPIGFVTSATYSLLRGQSYGIGFITKEALLSTTGAANNNNYCNNNLRLGFIEKKDKTNIYYYPIQIVI